MKKWIFPLLAAMLMLVLILPVSGAELRGTCGAGLEWSLDADGLLKISGTGDLDNFGQTQVPWHDQLPNIHAFQIDAGVGAISQEVFEGCDGLTDVYYGGEKSAWEHFAITLASSVRVHPGCTQPATHWRAETDRTSCTQEGYQWESCSCSFQRNRKPAEVFAQHDFQEHICSRCPVEMDNRSGSVSTGVTWKLYSDGCLEFGGSGVIPDYSFSYVSGTVNSPWHSAAAEEEISIKKLSFGPGISHIGNFALSRLDGLETLTVPGSIATIGMYAFERCAKLVSVTLEEGVRSAGYGAFDQCDALETVRINSTQFAMVPSETINTPFPSCPGLKAFLVNDANPNLLAEGGVLLSKDKTVLYKYPAALEQTHYSLPEQVKTVSFYAFSLCGNLKSVTFSAGLTRLDYSAFEKCTALTAAILPGGLRELKMNAFYGCTSLLQVSIPSTLESIGSQAFYNCANLTELSIPEGVKLIEMGAFGGTGLTGVTLPASVAEVRYFAFANTPLEKVYVLNKDCVLGVSAFRTPADLPLIHGWEGSTAETYAQRWGHVFEAHNFTRVLSTPTEPDCDTPGIQLRGCDNCTVTQEFPLPPEGHNYENGACTRCGKPDPGKTVTRLAGENRFDTAFKVARELKARLGTDRFSSIIVASGKGFADALSGSYLAAVKNAPILLSYKEEQNRQVVDYIRENLAEGGTVYILGGTEAVPETLEAGLTGLTVTRLAGENRFETNLAILQEAGVGNREILVCTGADFADSLSASAVGQPILLVYKQLTDSQHRFLLTHSGRQLCIVGGEEAVSREVAQTLSLYGTVTRLAGENRLLTSIMVAQRYFPQAKSAVLAYGWNFPDGLCGGSLGYCTGAPLLLTHSGESLYAVTGAYTAAAGLEEGYVLGGDTLVSDQAVRSIFSMADGLPVNVK